MSVIKAKRKESQFEVFHHFYKMRKEVTNLLLNDFGYDLSRANKRAEKCIGKPVEEMNTEEQKRYAKRLSKNIAFDKWFVKNERKTVLNVMRDITSEMFVANSIYPQYPDELIERRLHQDRAIGLCYVLAQELQYAIETLPVDINKLTRFTEMIQTEVKLLKGWRKSDNKFKRAFSDNLTVSGANFANVNNNGNANYNNASNSNGVRPDFNSTIK